MLHVLFDGCQAGVLSWMLKFSLTTAMGTVSVYLQYLSFTLALLV